MFKCYMHGYVTLFCAAAIMLGKYFQFLLIDIEYIETDVRMNCSSVCTGHQVGFVLLRIKPLRLAFVVYIFVLERVILSSQNCH